MQLSIWLKAYSESVSPIGLNLPVFKFLKSLLKVPLCAKAKSFAFNSLWKGCVFL